MKPPSMTGITLGPAMRPGMPMPDPAKASEIMMPKPPTPKRKKRRKGKKP